jgi:hypothetical protein
LRSNPEDEPARFRLVADALDARAEIVVHGLELLGVEDGHERERVEPLIECDRLRPLAGVDR